MRCYEADQFKDQLDYVAEDDRYPKIIAAVFLLFGTSLSVCCMTHPQ